MVWQLSHRADRRSLKLADRHYNRQKPGTNQFVPPGSCLVLLADDERATWTTSWPLAEYTKHKWPGAWINSMFRNESDYLSSDLIRQAVAATLWFYGDPPQKGMITFVDPTKISHRRRKTCIGYCYLMAGFIMCGWTKGGLMAFQMQPSHMPAPSEPRGVQMRLSV